MDIYTPSSNDSMARKGLLRLKKRAVIQEVVIAILAVAFIALAVVYFLNIPVSKHQSGRVVTPEMQQILSRTSDERIDLLEDRMKEYELLIATLNETIDDLKKEKIESEKKLGAELKSAKEGMDAKINSTYTALHGLFEDYSDLSMEISEAIANIQLVNSSLQEQSQISENRLQAIEETNNFLSVSLNKANDEAVKQNQLDFHIGNLTASVTDVAAKLASVNKEIHSAAVNTSARFMEIEDAISFNDLAVKSQLLTLKDEGYRNDTIIADKLEEAKITLEKNLTLLKSVTVRRGDVIAIDGRINELSYHVTGNVSRDIDIVKALTKENHDIIERLSSAIRQTSRDLTSRISSVSVVLEKAKQDTSRNISVVLDRVLPLLDSVQSELRQLNVLVQENITGSIVDLQNKTSINAAEVHKLNRVVKEDIVANLSEVPLQLSRLSNSVEDVKQDLARNISEHTQSHVEDSLRSDFENMQSDVMTNLTGFGARIDEFNAVNQANFVVLESKMHRNITEVAGLLSRDKDEINEQLNQIREGLDNIEGNASVQLDVYQRSINRELQLLRDATAANLTNLNVKIQEQTADFQTKIDAINDTLPQDGGIDYSYSEEE